MTHLPLPHVPEGGGRAVRGDLSHPENGLPSDARSYFRSSDVDHRDFCGTRGTLLSFDYPEDGEFGVLAGTSTNRIVRRRETSMATKAAFPGTQA